MSYLRMNDKDVQYLLIRKANLLIIPGWELIAFYTDGTSKRVFYQPWFFWVEDYARELTAGTDTFVDIELEG